MFIREAEYGEIALLRKDGGRRLGFKYSPEKHYIGMFGDDNIIIGCVGYEVGRLIKYHTDVVREDMRGKGIYSTLWCAREYALRNNRQPRVAFCTEKSIGKYLSENFTIEKEYKGSYKVKRNDILFAR